jgi:hypothetical protein
LKHQACFERASFLRPNKIPGKQEGPGVKTPKHSCFERFWCSNKSQPATLKRLAAVPSVQNKSVSIKRTPVLVFSFLKETWLLFEHQKKRRAFKTRVFRAGSCLNNKRKEKKRREERSSC